MSGILVVAEHTRGVLSDVSGELVGAALSVKDAIGGPVSVAIVGRDAASFGARMNLPGVDSVVLAAAGDEHFDAATAEQALCSIIEAERPRLVLIGHSASGLGIAAGIAARLGSGFAADVFGIGLEEGRLRATRSGYAGKVNIELEFPGKPLVVMTVRGATFKAPSGEGAAAIREAEIDLAPVAGRRTRHLDFVEAPAAGVDIGKAEFILSVGRGVQDEKNIPRFQALAERLGATLGCSRPVADSGWLHKAHQVGLTGKVAASCKLYVALGISGAVQHLHGMKHVETIIAVNTDPNAPIFNFATYGAVMDVFDFADAMEKLS
ncbi:electron transfer flavoprotein subunit alpha/FixB family protein [Castellaniella defragrans]|uniref:electron transfer flavoprotein subunit alpha/FixB family protein n=1 Tax=Castellaniella defragrans TaxID=75697 RepID=UPI0005BE91DD|nr:electron transfer flavoprotein subunit alpha/FixB family protein [Castellaniella defragrans]